MKTKTPASKFHPSLTPLLWSAGLLVCSLAGLAQTVNPVLSLDGNGDYVSIPSAAELQNPTEITVEAWLYPSNTAFGYFIMKGDGAAVYSARSYELTWRPGAGNNLEFSVFLGISTWGAVRAVAPPGHWVHVAGTYSSVDSVLRIYRNGVLVSQTTNDATGDIPLNHQLLRQTTLPLVFGGDLTHRAAFAAGLMDEVRVWNKARTQAEIAGSMSCRLTGTEANLAGYWNFDNSTAADVTGHGHDGTLLGNAAIVPLTGVDVIHGGRENLLSIRVSQVELCWPTLPSLWYQLQYSSVLTTNLWTPFMPWMAGNDTCFCTNDVVAANQPARFYRVAITNAP
jgi:hypothetical protein